MAGDGENIAFEVVSGSEHRNGFPRVVLLEGVDQRRFRGVESPAQANTAGALDLAELTRASDVVVRVKLGVDFENRLWAELAFLLEDVGKRRCEVVVAREDNLRGVLFGQSPIFLVEIGLGNQGAGGILGDDADRPFGDSLLACHQRRNRLFQLLNVGGANGLLVRASGRIWVLAQVT